MDGEGQGALVRLFISDLKSLQFLMMLDGKAAAETFLEIIYRLTGKHSKDGFREGGKEIY